MTIVYHSASNEFVAVVEHHKLSGRHGALRFVKRHSYSYHFLNDRAVLILLPIANLSRAGKRKCWRISRDPLYISGLYFVSIQRRVTFVRHDKFIRMMATFNHKIRFFCTDAEALPLSDRIKRHAIVRTNHFTGSRDDLPRTHINGALQEQRHVNLPNEAQPLGIFFVGCCKSKSPRAASHFNLRERADGKLRARKLSLYKTAQKVGLIFFWINAFEEPRQRTVPSHTRIMPRRHLCTVQVMRGLEEEIKLNFAVAEHVWIWRASRAILFHQVRMHARAILTLKIKRMERNT